MDERNSRGVSPSEDSQLYSALQQSDSWAHQNLLDIPQAGYSTNRSKKNQLMRLENGQEESEIVKVYSTFLESENKISEKFSSSSNLIVFDLRLISLGPKEISKQFIANVEMGQVIFFPANHTASIHFSSCKNVEVRVLAIPAKISPKILAPSVRDLPPCPFVCGPDEFLRSSMEALRLYSTDHWSQRLSAAQAIAAAAMHHVAFLWRSSDDFLGASLESVWDGRYREVLQHIELNLDANITVDSLAEIIGFSRYHFVRDFKRTVGLTPHQYVMDRRIERAKYLLRTTDLTITYIAMEVGFDNTSYFSSMFKRIVGISPTDHRLTTRRYVRP